MSWSTKKPSRQLPLESIGNCFRVALRPRLRTADLRTMREKLALFEKKRLASVVCVSGLATGSDLGWLAAAPREAREEYFGEMASLLEHLGDGPALGTVVTLDGNVCGSAIGIAAHATGCVVTERTRMSLPGPAFGYVPESFATYQLARLPAGLGAYLSLTGAS